MHLHTMEFSFACQGKCKSIKKDWAHVGVVGSGDMEVVMRKKNLDGRVNFKVTTPVRGFDKVWEKIFNRFVLESKLGDVLIEINDNNATPYIVSVRLKQVLLEAREMPSVDIWKEMQDSSFYEASARERARSLVDKGTFREFMGANDGITSPHLPELGEAVSFDDGVITGIGKIDKRPVFVISQEGRFIGGAVGEVGGAKMVGVFNLALNLYEKIEAKYPGDESRLPVIVWSFESGGVRLQEANAGLLVHAEVMELIQRCQGKFPIISIVGSKVGCFGGMGFVCMATDAVIMSELGRIGLTGPEVIEQVMGKQEFDSGDRALVYRITGGKNKYILRDSAFLVKDRIGDFRARLIELLTMPYTQLQQYRCIGNYELVLEQLMFIDLAIKLNPMDPRDIWEHFGNQHPEQLTELDYDDFIKIVKVRARGEA